MYDKVPTTDQMGEFMEYVRQQHYQSRKEKYIKPKKMKPRSQVLSDDDIDQLTDLSQDGVLDSSMKKLSRKERAKIREFTKEFRNMKRFDVPKHDCIHPKKKHKKDTILFEMELRAKSEPKEYSDAEQSAHQFSVRSKSIQVDKYEYNDIQAVTEAINKQGQTPQIDIYDLNENNGKTRQSPTLYQSVILNERRDACVGTDLSRRLLAPRDWFYSKIFRTVLQQVYAKAGAKIPIELVAKFKQHDDETVYRDINET